MPFEPTAEQRGDGGAPIAPAPGPILAQQRVRVEIAVDDGIGRGFESGDRRA
jgi:hypothetical protein